MLCTHKSTLHCAQISTWSTQWDIIVQDKDGHSANRQNQFPHSHSRIYKDTAQNDLAFPPSFAHRRGKFHKLIFHWKANFVHVNLVLTEHRQFLYFTDDTLNDIFHLCAIFLASLGSAASIREACPEQWVDASVSSYNSRLCWYKISQHHYWQWLQIRRITLGNFHTLDFSVCVRRHNNHHHYNHRKHQQPHHNQAGRQNH